MTIDYFLVLIHIIITIILITYFDGRTVHLTIVLDNVRKRQAVFSRLKIFRLYVIIAMPQSRLDLFGIRENKKDE